MFFICEYGLFPFSADLIPPSFAILVGPLPIMIIAKAFSNWRLSYDLMQSEGIHWRLLIHSPARCHFTHVDGGSERTLRVLKRLRGRLQRTSGKWGGGVVLKFLDGGRGGGL